MKMMKNFVKTRIVSLFEAMRNIAIIALVAIIGFSMTACGDEGSSGGGIVGTWTTEYGYGGYLTYETMVFNSDKTGTIDYSNTNNNVIASDTFTWSQSGSTITYKITYRSSSHQYDPRSFTYNGGDSFEFNDQLNLGGQLAEVTYTRVK